MIIRVQSKFELREISASGHLLYSLAKYKEGSFDREHWVSTWWKLVESGVAQVFGLEIEDRLVGALGLVMLPSPEDGVLTGMESFWYVRPEFRGPGLRLLTAAEKWSEDNGARRFIMVHLKDSMPEKLRRYYENRGYRETETHYMKEF